METCGKDTINKGQLWSKEHSPRPWCPCNGSRRKTNQASDCCDCNRWHELAVSSRAVRWELHRRGIPWLAFSCIRAVTCLWTLWCQKLKRRDSAAVPCALDSSLKRTHWLYVQSWASEQPRDLLPRVGWRAHLRARSGSGSAIRALITLWPHREVRAWALASRLTHVPTHCERRERGHSGVPLLEIETSPPLMCARTRRKKGERN